MNDWMEGFIARCLGDVPQGHYRSRAEQELRDHMLTRYLALTEGGAPPPQAREEVLRAMGDPDRLRKEYSAAWSRTPLSRAGSILGGCAAMGILYFLTGMMLFCLTMAFDLPVWSRGPIRTLCHAVLFLIPAALGAALLRACFQEEHRPTVWVTLGLLTAWAAERGAVLLVYALEFGIFGVFERIGQSALVPTFHPAYLALSFLGSLALGRIFGGKTQRSCDLP